MRKKPTVDEICKEAQKQTGLSCFGDNPIWRGCLESYFDDLYEHKDSNHLSRFIVRKESTKRVVQRLRVLNAFKEYPQALELELPSPIFVVGLPRTGSTFLHQCLAQDSKAMTVPFWQWFDPVPPKEGEKDERLQKAIAKLNELKLSIPILESIHLTEAEEADECYQGW
eukprot:CAMPEP_0206168500 /NCGR_PEP_ID=MMETSP1474-20131121/32337_1 /ASSEMBLY_ACC=CAM_ASM_001110 /TAXON_ID=97495 /ORGANISM="Imantonia sp., Strain RCC918" /LENGTH=168 /DNA_ID=CAMNT_0053573913 /DNA_START=22 /DNA_END=525 /DNA_ORIENTATION=+